MSYLRVFGLESGQVPDRVVVVVMARPSCLRLLEHFIRLAASRIFWTAGRSSPMRIAMIAMTTSSSIRVNAPRGRDGRRDMDFLHWGRTERKKPQTSGRDARPYLEATFRS